MRLKGANLWQFRMLIFAGLIRYYDDENRFDPKTGMDPVL